jgi:hypothetical protein
MRGQMGQPMIRKLGRASIVTWLYALALPLACGSNNPPPPPPGAGGPIVRHHRRVLCEPRRRRAHGGRAALHRPRSGWLLHASLQRRLGLLRRSRRMQDFVPASLCAVRVDDHEILFSQLRGQGHRRCGLDRRQCILRYVRARRLTCRSTGGGADNRKVCMP